MSSKDFYTLSDRDKEDIANLPARVAVFANEYPCEIVNVASAWNDELFESNYIPQYIEVYYDASEKPGLRVLDGIVTDYVPVELGKEVSTIQVIIDGKFAYIEIEGRIIINHLDGIILPEITVDSPGLSEAILKDLTYD